MKTRPLLFDNAEDLQKAIDKYFNDCDCRTTQIIAKTGELVDAPDPAPYTVTGLANSLGMDRLTLLRYENGEHTSLDEVNNEEICNAIKKAKSRVEEFAERKLYELRNPAGAIFNLINNYKGWSNKQEVITTNQPERISKEDIERLEDE